MKTAFILLSALLLGCAGAPLEPAAAERIDVDHPLLIVYREPGTDDLRVSVTPPPGYTVDTYGTVLVALVKFLALGFKVSEKDVWKSIDKARLVDAVQPSVSR